MGTVRVPRYIWALRKCPGKYWHRNNARAHMGTRMFPDNYGHRMSARAHIDNGRVPGNIWAPKWSTGKYRQAPERSRHIWVPEGRPGKYLRQNGSWSHLGTAIVLGHTLAPEGCPGTYGHWRMPGLISLPERCPGT